MIWFDLILMSVVVRYLNGAGFKLSQSERILNFVEFSGIASVFEAYQMIFSYLDMQIFILALFAVSFKVKLFCEC